MKKMLSSFREQSSSFLSNNSSNTDSNGDETGASSSVVSETTAPMPVIRRPFPCVEQPARIILTSHEHAGQRLTSTKKGQVKTAKSRGEREQFFLIPVDPPSVTVTEGTNDNASGIDNNGDRGENEAVRENERDKSTTENNGVFYLKSYKFNRYLSSEGGKVATIDLKENDEGPCKSHQWILMRSPFGGHFVVSARHELNLGCVDEKGTIGLIGENSVSESWDIEFVSGELCFLSTPPSIDKRIRCDLTGRLSLTKDRRGWEVWRFIETGGGKVKIVSWMHQQYCLGCDHDGKISTISAGKAHEGCDEWTVEKAVDGYEGVIIKSVACARRVLCHSENGLTTTQELEGESGIWQLDAAHSQTYLLTSLHHSKTIGPFPYVTEKLKQSDQLVLEQTDDEGTVRLYLKSKGKYVGSVVQGEVSANASPDETEFWKMEAREEGGYTFRSMVHQEMLALSNEDVNPKLCTVPEATEDKSEVWRVDPILPRAISSAKIKTFAMGTGLAVGTTVAMPFLMAGMLAVVPAEMTLMASVLSVGLTGAEAIASVGAIGVTAAIVFREDSDTLGIESESGDDDEKDYTKRPLCGWRAW